MGHRRSVSSSVWFACAVVFVWLVVCGVLPAGAGAAQVGASQFGEEGTGAGQLNDPVGVAVNNVPSSLFYGDVYVADQDNNRLDRFSGAGVFQMAWGWGVANGANEFQTCTTACRQGPFESCTSACGPFESFNTGSVYFGAGVAVDDNEPLVSSSSGDVYVEQASLVNRVEKFGPSGEFLLMFGGEVNKKKTREFHEPGNPHGITETEENVCVAGEECQAGTEGERNGQFKTLQQAASSIAVGPGGRVYVGDKAGYNIVEKGKEKEVFGTPRVQVFEPTGAWVETISLAGLNGGAKNDEVTALTVDSLGDVFVKCSEDTGVREFEPGGVERSVQFDTGSNTVTGLTVNGSGELFVGESSSEIYAHVVKYKIASGKAAGVFGFKTARGGSEQHSELPFQDGLAFSASLDSVYISESFYVYTQEFASAWQLTVPPPGPVVEGQSAVAGPKGSLTLGGLVNPEGNETTYHFEYVDDAKFKANGYADAVSTTPGTIPAGLEGRTVNVTVGGLLANTVYHYRIVASNGESITPAAGPDETVESLPVASIDSEYATNVASSSATIDAEVNPLGSSTEYILEYGTSTSYEHAVSGSAGEGVGDLLITRHLQELSPGTTYHYRFVLHNALGTIDGADRVFTSQSAGGQELSLPDGRAWELVSPPDKKAALIGPLPEYYWLTQAASDGGGITYTVNEPLGEGTVGRIFQSQVISSRGSGGWRTEDISPRTTLPPEGESSKSLIAAGEGWYLFSPNLGLGLFEPGTEKGHGDLTPQSAEATELSLYLRHSDSGVFQPLEDPADVAEGAKLGNHVVFFSATPDLAHVVFGSPAALTSETGSTPAAVEGHVSALGSVQTNNLYEWNDGALELVNVLPNGTTSPGDIGAGSACLTMGSSVTSRVQAVSGDGRWVVWSVGGGAGECPLISGSKTNLYVRDMQEQLTLKIGGSYPRFELMSSDGSKIFYVETEKGEGGDLHVFEPATGTDTDLTGDHGVGEASAGVHNGVLGASRDGSYIYFVASGVLASGGVKGADNLYVAHDEVGSWTTTHVATLSSEDSHSWGGTNQEADGSQSESFMVTSEVSPNGRFVAFMSNVSLTGYDNVDAVSGQRDEEVFLYDAATGGHLVCVSCDPTGARPVGVFDQGDNAGNQFKLLVDEQNAWSQYDGGGNVNHYLAGSLVGWNNELNLSSYEPRYVMDNGRLFFNSPEALVSQDTNGLEDVYEYEPVGVGGCAQDDSGYSEVTGGCVGLISSGQSSEESAFMDASETGDDVFFATSQKLVSADYDNAYDLYDAHACSASVPCRNEPVEPPECTSGDSCKAAPSPQPTIFGPAPSATFKGVGNFTATTTGSATARSLARTQKLARALHACQKDKQKRKRLSCEHQAHKRYGEAKQSRTASGKAAKQSRAARTSGRVK